MQFEHGYDPAEALPLPIGHRRHITPELLEEELKRFCFELLAPLPDIPVWQWAEEHISLPERSGALPGRYSTTLTPYIREPLQCFGDKSVTDLTLCWGTQVAKTTLIMIGVAYRIPNDPMNCLWVMPGGDLGKSFSKNRWIPMVDACIPVAAEKPRLPNGKSNRYLFGYMEQQFDRMVVNFVGSNSAAQLASRPAGLICMDETDKFKLDDEREAGALQNAEERTKNFPYPLRVKTSTPTTVHGEIWKEFLLGDQRYFNLPCPHCSTWLPSIEGKSYEDLDADERTAVATFITLKFRTKNDTHGECGVRWWREGEDESKSPGPDGKLAWDLEKVRRNAHYKCQSCGGEIADSQKSTMLRRGIWVATNPHGKPGRRSYHLSSLYSLLSRECTMGALAVKWLETKGNLSKRHGFINSTLAETWDDDKAVDDAPVFMESFGQEDLPHDITRLMSIDVQETHFWVLVRAFAPPSPERPQGESWLIHFDKVETIEEATQIQKEYGVENIHVCIDINRYQNKVAKWIVERGNPDDIYDSWRGLWGSDKGGFIHTLDNGQRFSRHWSPVQYRDPHLGTAFASDVNKKALWVYWANDPVKDLVAVLRFTTEPVIFHVHTDAHKDYQRHLNAEIKVAQRNHRTGRTVYFWKQLRKDNHALDCECMVAVRAMQLGLLPTPEETPATTQRTLALDGGG